MARSCWIGAAGRMAVGAAAMAGPLAIVGCLPLSRINAECRWTHDAERPLPANRARRAHMIEDARVAKDLGIRYADATAGRMNTPAWHTAMEQCTQRSLGEIARAHGVSQAELAALTTARELWIDIAAVLLPGAMLFAAASAVIVARVLSDYERDDRGIAAMVLVALMPFAAVGAVVFVQIWGSIVEQLRLRNDHISYRAFELPANRHGWLLWGIAMALFAGMSARGLLRQSAPATPRCRVPR